MNSREKIQNALNHKEGTVPVDMGSLPVTGLHVSLVSKLRDYLGLEKRISKVLEPYQMLGVVEDDLRDALGIDTQPLWGSGSLIGKWDTGNWVEWLAPWGETVLVSDKFVTKQEGERIYTYADGDTNYPPTAVMALPSYFFDAIIYQDEIDDDNLNPQDNLAEYSEIDSSELLRYKQKIEELKKKPYSISANFGGTAFGDIAMIPGSMLKEKKGIRDIEEWYVSLAIRQDYIHKVFEGQCEIALKNLQKVYETVGDDISVAMVCGTDFGTQHSTFCSPDTFRSLYMPYYKQINEWIHKNTNWKTFKHSCGAVFPLVECMIEAGFDIINPVQWTANGMEAKNLKATFGKDMTFWGGGVDTQSTLPFKSPEDVRREVLTMLEVLAKDGGYVFNSIHNLLSNSPVENIVAMFSAVKEFNSMK